MPGLLHAEAEGAAEEVVETSEAEVELMIEVSEVVVVSDSVVVGAATEEQLDLLDACPPLLATHPFCPLSSWTKSRTKL